MTRVKKIIKQFLISIVCLTAIDSFAQQSQNKTKPDQYRVVHWGTEEGLNSTIANILIKDAKGFLWIGNAGGGLSRFDGADFKDYIPDKHKPFYLLR